MKNSVSSPEDVSTLTVGLPEGITLRDWYATQFIEAGHREVDKRIASLSVGQTGWSLAINDARLKTVAEFCYEQADAMLKAREVHTQTSED